MIKIVYHTRNVIVDHMVFATKYCSKVFYGEKRIRVKRNNKNAMPMEGSRNNRRKSMTEPHIFTFKYTIQNEYIWIYGIFEREE